MIITQHGKKDPLFKLVAKACGRRVVFFGWSEGHVRRKHQEWLLAHQPVRPARVVERKVPALRLIAGGRSVQGVA